MVKLKQSNQKRPFLASTVVTLFIVIMLIISGPAQAVSVSILGLQGTYTQGSNIQFQVKIDISDPDQFVPAKDISLNLTGPANPSAVFSLDGTKISGDSIIRITGVQIPRSSDFGYGYGYGKDSIGYGYGYESFGYGYGYGYGRITDFGYGYGYGYNKGTGYGYGYGYGNLTYIYNVTIETSTLPVGDYNVVVSLRAENNAITKIFTSATGQFTIISATPSGKSSRKSSGNTESGVMSSEPFDNVESSEVATMSLLKDQSVTYTFSIVPRIYEVAVVGNANENSVSLRVESLKGTSKLVTAAPDGIVSKNMNIFSSSSGIQNALVRFKVENTWMQSNSLSSSDMKLVKWDGSKWVQLETTEKNKDNTYTYFEAKTESFSSFAITGLKGATAGTTPRVTPGGTRSGITPVATSVSGVTPTTPTATSTNLSAIAIVVVILIVIGVAMYLRRR